MWIKNAGVYIEEHRFEKKDIEITGDRITRGINSDSGSDNTGVICENDYNAEGLKMIPGLIDLHFHGAVGHDFCDADNEGLTDADYDHHADIELIADGIHNHAALIRFILMEEESNSQEDDSGCRQQQF